MTPEIGKKFELLNKMWKITHKLTGTFRAETPDGKTDNYMWLDDEDAPKLSWLPEPVKKLTNEQAFQVKKIMESSLTSKRPSEESYAFYEAINNMTENV